MFIGDMFNEDNFHAGDNAWSSEHDQWAKESINENEMQIGDEVLVTYRNEFQGKRGEIVGFGRDKAFVIVEIDGKQYSMHSSDVEVLSSDYDDDDRGLFGDDERDELDEYKGAHDKITFEVDSEQAYNHVMDKYGHVIDWDGDYMTVPARYWPAVQELAFAAGGDVQEIGIEEGVMKSIKRGLQGWYGDDTGPNGEKLGDPRDVVRRNKGHDDETLQRFAKSIAGEKKTKHSPGELQQRIIDREMKKRGLGEDTGGYYYEILAQKVFDERPNFSTKGRADELVDYAYRFAVQDLGKSRARYEFNYDEDFLSDFVSAYAELQRGEQGVAESTICPVCGCTPCNCTHITNEDSVEDFLARGGKIQHVNAQKGPRHPGLSLASKHIGGGGDKMKASRTGRGSKPQGKAVVAVEEGASVQDVFNAITYRIERQMPELFTSYGVEVVANAIKDVAEFHEGAEELGSSDVGGMVREVVRQLKHQELRKSLDEVKKMSTQAKFEKHLAKHGYDVAEKSKYWDQKIKDIDAQIAAWDAEMERRKQGVAEGEYDDPRFEPREPDMSRKVDWDIEAERNKPEEQEAAKTVTVTDNNGKVVLTFPSTGGFYGDLRYATSKGFDTDSGEYHMSWKRDVAESNYWDKLQQERYLKEHKKVASLVNELTEIFKDK